VCSVHDEESPRKDGEEGVGRSNNAGVGRDEEREVEYEEEENKYSDTISGDDSGTRDIGGAVYCAR
ncbi:hypothetical protein KI387_028286, partial [Taxus chinensis]